MVRSAVLYCVVFPNELGTVYKCSKALKFLLWKVEAPTLWEQTGEMSKYSHPHRSWLQYPRLLRGGRRGLTEFHPFLNSTIRVISIMEFQTWKVKLVFSETNTKFVQRNLIIFFTRAILKMILKFCGLFRKHKLD